MAGQKATNLFDETKHQNVFVKKLFFVFSLFFFRTLISTITSMLLGSKVTFYVVEKTLVIRHQDLHLEQTIKMAFFNENLWVIIKFTYVHTQILQR